MEAPWEHFRVQLQLGSGKSAQFGSWNCIQFQFGPENFKYNYSLGQAIQPRLGLGFGLHKQLHSDMVLATPVGLAIQSRLDGAGDTFGSANSAQFGSGNSIHMVLATPLGLAIQLSLGGAGDTFGSGN